MSIAPRYGVCIYCGHDHGEPGKPIVPAIFKSYNEQAAMLNSVIAQRDELLAALIHIQQVACSGSPELGIATAAIAKSKP